MDTQIQDNMIYRTSTAVTIQYVGNSHYAVWNRYMPSVYFLNEDGIKLLKYMYKNNNPYKIFKGFKRILRKMISNNLLYSEPEDPYKKNFLKSGELLLKKIDKSMRKVYAERTPYRTFSIFNRTCNLKCPYCIVSYVRNKNHKHVKKTKKEKIERLLKCIDRLFHNPDSDKGWIGSIVFNGGEILLEWEMIKTVVNYIKIKYPRASVEFSINTNATLITEEIAKFLAKHKFESIGISIDGYRKTHNKTRCYRDGTGSFDDVIRAINILNRYLSHPIESYQGTLIPKHELDIEKLMEMKNYNFKKARLGVNLLGITQEDSKKMADLLFKVAIKSIENEWKIGDYHFISYISILSKKRKGFTFYCRGLTDLAGKGLYYNIDTEMVNILCSYVTDVQVSLNEINDDIYHPLVFEKGLNFLRRRFETFKEVCKDCEIAGICRGGCLMTGIDPFNKKNEAACIFQKETWKHFLKYSYSHND